MHDTRTRIALLPLDERPVNTQLPADVAAIAGFELVLPPTDALPRFREAGNPDRLADWLTAEVQKPNTAAAIVSIDTLVHGGLIPARISTETTASAISKLDRLRAIKDSNPNVALSAVSLITRASDSYSNVEEPEYWDQFGRELHHLGALTHRSWADSGVTPDPPELPETVRADFAARRLRNHLINLAALGLRWEGVIDYLAITADDTAPHSSGSAEQNWIRYWQLLRPSSGVAAYPGADETGAVLVARTIAAQRGISPTVRVVAADPTGLSLVPPYENEPLTTSIRRQIAASGAQPATDHADIVLVIHTPDPQRGDMFSHTTPATDRSAVAGTVTAVREALSAGSAVTIADVRYANGSDPALITALAAASLLEHLTAYSGWNTAGNALGSALAQAVAAAVADQTGTLNQAATHRALIRRLLDDHAYQSVLRARLAPTLFNSTIRPVAAAQARHAEPAIARLLQNELDTLGLPTPLVVERVGLPWNRSFEVEISLADGATHP
ncbi:DUF4127 family protein [Glaciibacter psychrotolerans]|uniref:DUF4127 family protein n=1 Tax=Glaciibacter psychrotolerans TaxID=670054 RepID=A0A7Z0EDZ6_9MICO|nr:DUF4127 family protein [Leifsonia psychrotolerans]NYJ19726.1 hypothetical protein [Leifsonia psychrotolerans]